MTKFIKFFIFALAIATLWCAMPCTSHSRTTHACACPGCVHGSCQMGCQHTDDATHTLEYLTLAAGSIGSSDTCSCTNCPKPIAENAVAVIDQDIENMKKVPCGAFYVAAGPATSQRRVTFAKIQSIHIPAVQQLYILNSSLLL